MALGIYEDTGNFTFVSTTPADYEAAAWLLQQGANLPLVSSLITRELTAEDVALLGDLISNAVTMNVGGVPVVISEVSVRRYVPEFAVLVHKFMDMENLDVLFALARMEGRVHLVARSRLPQVDAGAIATAMGGGGHPSAASATMRDLTLVEARAKLERLIRTQVNPGAQGPGSDEQPGDNRGGRVHPGRGPRPAQPLQPQHPAGGARRRGAGPLVPPDRGEVAAARPGRFRGDRVHGQRG